jgi:quinoprotein glucose dehydrogenase
MPLFPASSIFEDQMNALLLYLGTSIEENSNMAAISLQQITNPSTASAGTKREMQSDADTTRERYRFTGYCKFLDPEGYPAVVPPWGTLNAIDLNTGKYLWKIPLGEYPELAQQGMKDTGTENYGGPIVTAGGLVFIRATMFDKKIRAFDSHTGALLWRYQLPYAGVATPATYMIDGKQYVVIAAGGGRDLKSRSGGVYVAFALRH